MPSIRLVAALAVLLCAPAWAQMRGAAHVGDARAAGGVRGVGMTARSNGRNGGGSGHGSTHGGSGSSSNWHHHHNHHHFGSRYARYGYWGYPGAYAYYPGYWDYPLDYSDYDQSYNQNQQLQAYQLQLMNNQQEVEQRINAIEDRLDRLYEQRSAPSEQPPPQTQSKSDRAQPAVLVYKDGHRQEVQNYAIIGQTIWVLNEEQAKRVPLSALDVNATRKANQERDVDFALPGSSS